MKTLWMLIVVLGVMLPPGRVVAGDAANAPPGRPANRFTLGISLTRYAPDFSPLDQAYTAIEDQYRSQGYTISAHTPAIEVAPLLAISLRLRPVRRIGLLLETGTSMDKARLDCKSASASLLFFPPVAGRTWEPYLGAGIGRYRFSAARQYGQQISPVDGNGGYDYLDKITVDGSGTGAVFTAAVDAHEATTGVGLGAFVSYLVLLDRVTGQLPDGSTIRVDMNSLMFGARFLVYL